MALSTRERIVDAAAEVLRTKGLAAATTREIARAAGCSEALLYKHFVGKQELFIAVLIERMPMLPPPGALAGTRTVSDNLTELVGALIAFYVDTFPMAASIFGDAELRDAHRAKMTALGAGPDGPARLIRSYLEAEVGAGRLSDDLDVVTLARLFAGAALFEAFQAAYAGEREIERTTELARSIVDAVANGVG